MNSLRRRRCCKPTAHCNKSRVPVDILEKLCLRRKLRPATGKLAVQMPVAEHVIVVSVVTDSYPKCRTLQSHQLARLDYQRQSQVR